MTFSVKFANITNIFCYFVYYFLFCLIHFLHYIGKRRIAASHSILILSFTCLIFSPAILCFLLNQQIASIRCFLVCVRSRTLSKVFLFSVNTLQLRKRSALHYNCLTGDKYAFVSYTTYHCLYYNYHTVSFLFPSQFFEFCLLLIVI